MRSRNNELCVGQTTLIAFGGQQLPAREFLNLMDPVVDAYGQLWRDREARQSHEHVDPFGCPDTNSVRVGRLAGFYEIFGKRLVLFQVGMGREGKRDLRIGKHDTVLFALRSSLFALCSSSA